MAGSSPTIMASLRNLLGCGIAFGDGRENFKFDGSLYCLCLLIRVNCVEEPLRSGRLVLDYVSH